MYVDDAVIFTNHVLHEIRPSLRFCTSSERLQDFGSTELNQQPPQSAVTTLTSKRSWQILGDIWRPSPSDTWACRSLCPGQSWFIFVLDRIRARLAGWKGRLMNIAGRRVLVRAVLSAIPTFAMTTLRMPKKFFKEIDKARRRFLWVQEEELTGGKCKVSWSKICSPIS